MKNTQMCQKFIMEMTQFLKTFDIQSINIILEKCYIIKNNFYILKLKLKILFALVKDYKRMLLLPMTHVKLKTVVIDF